MHARAWFGVGLALLMVAFIAVVVVRSRVRGRTATRPTRFDAPAAAEPPARADAPSRRPDEPAEPQEPSPLDDPQARMWASVDLNALQAELPDNIYWKMAVPTKDPAILEAREAERERWNVEYGKVLSNTATAGEVDAYYAHRYKLSSDYVELATLLLNDYGERLPQRDVALLKLAIEMHLARLEEIPRQIVEAHERREAHEAARRDWLEQQKAFGQPVPPDPPADFH
ncbi:MAG TPA: hypothetical protein VMS22_09830 [Candidatus Eisenbacteria bacterium]|nr:hypothetical protein [Candidatus Eisenbacteria bacterium]